MTLLFKRLLPSSIRHLSGTTRLSSRVAPRSFPTTGFTTIPSSEKLEEEKWPWYTPQSYYPVKIGEVFQERYQVLYKLEYATTANFWICRDLTLNSLVCLKSLVLGKPRAVTHEIKAYQTLSKENPSEGMKYIRPALDHFKLRHGEYNYHFIVHEPLRVSLEQTLDDRTHGHGLGLLAVRNWARKLLSALESLHNAKIIHTDIQGANIVLRMEDEDLLKEWEEDEIANPSSRKITADSIIFKSKEYAVPVDRLIGPRSVDVPILCELGGARMGRKSYRGYIQPGPYRSPEVLLHLPWTTSTDIWNLGCMLWEIVTNEPLFPRGSIVGPVVAHVDGVHLASMAMLLGRPPRALLQDSGARAREFFNEDGSAKYHVPLETLEARLSSALEGDEDAMTADQVVAFAGFIRRMLIWEGNKRPTASELLNDPWITDDSDVDGLVM